jgi:hypothetical protein
MGCKPCFWIRGSIVHVLPLQLVTTKHLSDTVEHQLQPGMGLPSLHMCVMIGPF